MDSEGVLLRLIHEHSMIPCNDLRIGDCCGRFEATSDGYYCKTCDFFVHKKCVDEASESIEHPSHPAHTLQLLSKQKYRYCNLCGRDIKDLCYHFGNFDVDLYCAKYPPPEVIESSETPCHKLTLIKEKIEFYCDARCGKPGFGFPYKCLECGLTFHIDCVWDPSGVKHLPEVIHPVEVKNHSCHSLHPLKLDLTGQLPDYSDGKCRLMPGSVVKAATGSYEVVLNKNVSRPFCRQCKSHCMYPIIYKIPETSDSYLCSDICIKRFTKRD
ncbi:unnamed protein product [Arabidopsis thaliana]|uniref:(thale cress) hypothetical protein n=1 Tax=Arabidopsis thaliana TaxID=3702 RepID=A0A7G2EUH0_ARATH|nr:unnamed protein product [Arabidopsis thaliana]